MGPDDGDFKFWYNHGRRLNSRMPMELIAYLVILAVFLGLLKLVE
jgi:hypothetical protein